jgi:hypothetical protein
VADSKTFPLSIIIKAIDKATGPIKAINEQLKPLREAHEKLDKEMKTLGEGLGVEKVTGAFRGLGDAIGNILTKLAEVGGLIAAIAYGVNGLIDSYAKLGHVAEQTGLGANDLAALHDVARRAGVSIDAMDESLVAFVRTTGQLELHKGRAFALLKAGGAAEFVETMNKAQGPMNKLLLFANALKALHGDTELQTAFAGAFHVDPALIPRLEKGALALRVMGAVYKFWAGDQQKAVDAALRQELAMAKLNAQLDRVKATIVTALAPAFTQLTNQLGDFLEAHKTEIAAFIEDFGKKLPGYIQDAVGAFKDVAAIVGTVWDAIGGLRGAAIVLGVVLGGPLVVALAGLAAALIANPIGLLIIAFVGLAAVAAVVIKDWEPVKQLFADMLGIVEKLVGGVASLAGTAASVLRAATGHSPEVNATEQVLKWRDVQRRVAAGVSQMAGAFGTSYFEGPGKGRTGADDFAAAANLFAGRRSLGVDRPPGPGAGGSSGFARVRVDINGPPGTRVSTDPGSTVDAETTLNIANIPSQIAGWIP